MSSVRYTSKPQRRQVKPGDLIIVPRLDVMRREAVSFVQGALFGTGLGAAIVYGLVWYFIHT